MRVIIRSRVIRVSSRLLSEPRSVRSQLLLERHLMIMREELVAAVPEKRRVYAALTRNARHLKSARLEAIPARKAASIAATFMKAAPSLWLERIPEMGSLLVAAVAEERNGIEGAVHSIEEWVYDKERFPQWIRAARNAIAAARG